MKKIKISDITTSVQTEDDSFILLLSLLSGLSGYNAENKVKTKSLVDNLINNKII